MLCGWLSKQIKIFCCGLENSDQSVDGWFGFGAVFGFLSCLLMVLFAKALGVFLKRPRDYYPEYRDDA